MSAQEPVIDVRDLKVTFATDAGDVAAVRGVSLHVDPGQVLAIVGESGSGKTVTARSILGLLPETALASGAVVLRRNDDAASSDVLSLSPSRLR
ncbi:MAG: ATP-binding cassette domain-containing protein, partial [Cellulomonas sp.]|nr:ATP-binding cassette domain-containing protein [Cellulomonas sp.]